MEMGTLFVVVPLVVALWYVYELVLRKQWWFYHVSRIMRDIRDKFERD
jgi:hypothetical protein